MLIKNIRASLARLISPPGLPTVTIPDIGTPAPGIVAQTSAAPVATAAPGTLVRANPVDLAQTIEAVRVLRTATPSVRAQAVAARPATARSARPALRAAAPASTDDDAPQKTEPVDYAGIISTLEGIVEDLKSKAPVDDSDKADEASARAAASAGRLTDAVDRFSALALKLQSKVTAKKSRSALLALPSSRERAAKLTASGFNNDPVVAQLNQALGRGGLSLADRAALALAPVAGRTPPAPRADAATSRSDSRPDIVKINSIRAELAALDTLQRREGFTNERNARHATLTRELKIEIRKFQVR